MLLDFRLNVWYHGLKATQYFSKFTPESIKVLKEDLTLLGLPHPRKENISLLSHGAVECFWPSAEQNHVLHKNLLAKTRQTPEFNQTISDLSILSITVKESPATRAKVEVTKPTSIKRPYEPPSVPIASTSQMGGTSRGQQTAGRLPNQSASGYRPHHAIPNAGSSRTFPLDDSYRPNKVAKTHSQGFQLSARSANDNGHPINFPESVPAHRSQASSFRTTTVNRDSPFNRPPHVRHIVKRSPNPMGMNTQPPGIPHKPSSPVVKVKEEVVDAFLNNLDLHSTVSKREPPATTVPFSPKPKTTAVSLSDTPSVAKVHFLPNNGLAPSNVRIENEASTTAVVSDTDDRIPGLDISNRRTINVAGTAVQLPTPPVSAPATSLSLNLNPQPVVSPPTLGAPTLDSRSLLRPRPSTDQRVPGTQGNTSAHIAPTPPSFCAKEASAPAKQPVDVAAQQLADLRGRSQNVGDRWEEGYASRRHSVQENPDAKVLELLDGVIKELRKELEGERRLRREDKKLLEAERQLREEAENALADVRRECRQPFVVPSLLDTFVELSKLTTRGLKVSGSNITANAAPGYPLPRDHREVENAPGPAVNGQEGIDSLHIVAQRTKVKREPLDDDVL